MNDGGAQTNNDGRWMNLDNQRWRMDDEGTQPWKMDSEALRQIEILLRNACFVF